MRYASSVADGIARRGCIGDARPPSAPVESDDLLRIREVSDPQLSPDGAWVAYTVSTSDTRRGRAGRRHLDVELGRQPQRPAHPDQASRSTRPRWSPDGRYLAFLSARDDPREVDQVWLLDRSGGEAERVTDLPGGVSDYAWSPDGSRLALIASDPDPDAGPPGPGHHQAAARARSWWTASGSSTTRSATSASERDHLYLFTLADRKAELITPGDYDEAAPVVVARRAVDRVPEPAPSGVRPDRQLGPLRRRRHARRRAAPAHHLRRARTWIPSWGSRAPELEPRREAHRLRPGREAGAALLRRAEGGGGAGGRRPGAGAHRVARPERAVAHVLARRRVGALPAGGRPGLPPRAGARRRAARSSGWSKGSGRSRTSRSGKDGRIAVTSSTTAAARPRSSRSEGGELRQISRQNDAWLPQVRLAPVEEISFKSRDGTPINGFMVKPPDYRRGHALSHDPPDPRRTGVAVLPRLRQPRLAGPRGAAATWCSA